MTTELEKCINLWVCVIAQSFIDFIRETKHIKANKRKNYYENRKKDAKEWLDKSNKELQHICSIINLSPSFVLKIKKKIISNYEYWIKNRRQIQMARIINDNF